MRAPLRLTPVFILCLTGCLSELPPLERIEPPETTTSATVDPDASGDLDAIDSVGDADGVDALGGDISEEQDEVLQSDAAEADGLLQRDDDALLDAQGEETTQSDDADVSQVSDGEDIEEDAGRVAPEDSSNEDASTGGDTEETGLTDVSETGPSDTNPADTNTTPPPDTSTTDTSGPESDPEDITSPTPEEDTEQPSGEPPSVFFTIGQLPDFLNGSIDYVDDFGQAQDFVVRTPKANTCLGLRAEDPSGPIDWSKTRLTCDAEYTPFGGLPIPAGTFSDVGSLADLDAEGWFNICGVLSVSDAESDIQCLAEVQGPGGKTTVNIAFQTTTLFPQNDPFFAEQTWMLMFSRDIWDHQVGSSGGGVSLVTTYEPQGNGVPDFDEALAAIGLMDPFAPEVGAWVKAQVTSQMRDYIQQCYDPRGDGGIRMKVVVEGADDAPDYDDYIPGYRTDAGFSAIPIGGAAFPGDMIWGRCPYDPHNQRNEDVMLGDNQGVMVTEMARQILMTAGMTSYPTELLPIIGDPFGTLPDDIKVTADGFNPAQNLDAIFGKRLDQVMFGIDLVAAFAGMVACHEIGHSVGLVPFGAPPDGLFAGITGPAWIGGLTDQAHCEIGNNIMAAGLAIEDAFELAATPKTFMPLVEAYLRREIVVGDPTFGSDLYMINQGQVVGGGPFLACWDSNHGEGCVQGGQQGLISIMETSASSEIVVRMSGPGLANTLHQLVTLGADAGTKSVGYWIDLATTADLSVAYMATATIPSAGKTVVWATFTKPTTESVEVGQSDVRVELVGHPEPAWYALDAAGSEFARDEDIGPQQTRYGAVFFGVEPGDYDMRVTREVNGEESAHHCNPLTAWGQPAAGLIRVMTESDHVSRPTIICE